MTNSRVLAAQPKPALGPGLGGKPWFRPPGGGRGAGLGAAAAGVASRGLGSRG